MEYAQLRKKMADEQLRARGITDARVLAAFGKIERHKFIPEELRWMAYADQPVQIGHAQTISQPYIVALMTEHLGLNGKEKVMEVGTGSGYQAAILAELAHKVYTIERIGVLASAARDILGELGYGNIKFKIDDGTLGWPEEAPFDRIIITAAASRIPLPLAEQLKEGGKAVLPIGEEGRVQVLTRVEKKERKLIYYPICDCAFVPLVGKYGCLSSDI